MTEWRSRARTQFCRKGNHGQYRNTALSGDLECCLRDLRALCRGLSIRGNQADSPESLIRVLNDERPKSRP